MYVLTKTTTDNQKSRLSNQRMLAFLSDSPECVQEHHVASTVSFACIRNLSYNTAMSNEGSKKSLISVLECSQTIMKCL